MDYQKALEELIRERDRIARVIEALESLLESAEPPESAPRRGRKGMSERERRIVSERMKEYWRNRKRGAAPKSGR